MQQDADLEAAVLEAKGKNTRGWPLLLLSYQAVGVVYGGIGSSPLYVFPNVWGSTPTEEEVLGAVCLIFWTLTIITVFKYLLITLWANDHGEGGTFAIYSLLCRHLGIAPHHAGAKPAKVVVAANMVTTGSPDIGAMLARALQRSPRLQTMLLVMVLLGTSMILGDGILTAAASVISAMAGLQVAAPSLSNDVVVWTTVAILVALFSVQGLGTARVSAVFSPVLLVWFLLNAGIGVYQIAAYSPGIFRAISPYWGARFFIAGRVQAWLSLGGIVLCITGSEALFADMGHFSHRAIVLSAFALVYPCLILIYFGEAAYLTTHPENHANAYFAAIPAPLFWPAFVVATAAALVGTQSLITSAFSIIRQSMRMSCFPRLTVKHTGHQVEGQIYIPQINWALCILSVAVVLGFRSTTAIGNAFGLAVVSVMMITTALVTIVMLVVWRTPAMLALAFFAFLCFVEGVYTSALMCKVPNGGWFPLVLGSVLLGVGYIWHWGSAQKLSDQTPKGDQRLDALLIRAPNGAEEPPGPTPRTPTGGSGAGSEALARPRTSSLRARRGLDALAEWDAMRTAAGAMPAQPYPPAALLQDAPAVCLASHAAHCPVPRLRQSICPIDNTLPIPRAAGPPHGVAPPKMGADTPAPSPSGSSSRSLPRGLQLVASGTPVARAPGLGVFFSKDPCGVPPAFACLVASLAAAHSTVVFLTIRQVMLPTVVPADRFLVEGLGLPGLFRVVFRHGYCDGRGQGPGFLDALVAALTQHLHARAAAGMRSAADLHVDALDPDDVQLSVQSLGRAGAKALRVATLQLAAARSASATLRALDLDPPLLIVPSPGPAPAPAGPSPAAPARPAIVAHSSWSGEGAIMALRSSVEAGVTYVLLRTVLRAGRRGPGLRGRLRSAWVHVCVAGYSALAAVSRSPAINWDLPAEHTLELGVVHTAT